MNRNGLLDETKAGLTSIDRDTVNKIITQETHGTAKFLRMHEKERASCARSEVLAQRASILTPRDIKQETYRIDQMISETVQSLRDWRNIIAVLDFDCFYASVEERDKPALRGKPVIITGGSIVCASNYVARKYGIRSAMPTHVAKALCKDVVAVSASMEKYMSVSHAATEIFARYDAHYSMHGLDECVLNLTAYIERYAYEKYGIVDIWDSYSKLDEEHINSALAADSDPAVLLPNIHDTNTLFKGEPGLTERLAAEAVSLIRKDVQSHLGITCSVGVAINQQVAKIFTDLNKPDGQTIGPLHSVTQDNYSTILHSHLKELNIRKLWGIGDASAQLLSREPFTITSIGDIFLKRGLLSLLLTPTQAKFYIFASVGLSNVYQLMNRNGPNPKSVGQECTFPETSNEELLRNVLRNLCKLVAQRLQEQDLVPTRLNVKVRFADWIEKTHVVNLARHSWDLDVLYLAALDALRHIQKCKTDEVGYPTSTGGTSDGAEHGAGPYRGTPYLTVGFGVYRRFARCTDIRLLGVTAHTFLESQDSNSRSVLYQLNRAKESYQNCVRGCTKDHSAECIDLLRSTDMSDEEVITISSSSSDSDCYPPLAFKMPRNDHKVKPARQKRRMARVECTQRLRFVAELKQKHSFIISSKPPQRARIGRSSA